MSLKTLAAALPYLSGAIISLAKLNDRFGKPARHIYDSDGTLYMRRYHLIREGGVASRVLRALTGYSALRVHNIVLPDSDRDLHNHPFDFRSFVLRGIYIESRMFGYDGGRRTAQRRRGTTHKVTRLGPDFGFHRIAEVWGSVWTLVATTESTHQWGFLVRNAVLERQIGGIHEVYMDHQTYFNMRCPDGWPGEER